MSMPEPKEESPPPSPWQPPASAKAAAVRSRTAIAWLALALAVLIVAVGTAPFWAPDLVPLLPWGQPPPATDRDADAIRDLTARLDSDEAALKEQATRLSQLKTDELALKDQAARLKQLEARPGAPSATQAPAPPPMQTQQSAEAVKALQTQLAKLTADQTATDARVGRIETKIAAAGQEGRADRSLLLALANLRVAIEGSGPFAAELEAAQAVAGNRAGVTQPLAALRADAAVGLPSLAAMAEQFDRAVAPAILRARGDIETGDWWQQIRSRLERMVVIRRIGPGGPVSGDATEAAVARADAALTSGDLAGAVAALAALSGPRADAAARWLTQARRRLAAEAAVAKLWQAEAARVAAGDAPSGAKP
jgi:hypothetical protein